MTNDDFQLEELENAAVKKSNNAKRAAAIGAAVAGSGAIGVAGKAAYDNVTGDQQDVDDIITQEDIEEGAQVGANQVEAQQQPEPVAEAPRVQQAPAPTPPAPTPTPPEPDVDITFDKTTHIYDEDNNLLATTEEGTLEGKDFMLIDVDNDMNADVLAYDADGSGFYDENEIVELRGSNQIQMGNPTSQHEDVWIQTDEPDPIIDDPYIDDPFNIDEKYDDDNGIRNDFVDEKTGEDYSNDYAEDNEDYNNHGDVDHYTASANDDLADITNDDVVEDDVDDEFDDYNDTLASNDTVDDSVDDYSGDDFDMA